VSRYSPYIEFLKSLQKRHNDPLKQKERERTLKLIDWFAHVVLNSLPAHIAILDQEGVIIQTNQAWREFALSNEIGIRPSTIGVNYLELCDSAEGETAKGANEVAQGIRAVISGEKEEFKLDYSLKTATDERWFYLRVTRLSKYEPIRVVVSHEEITKRKQAEEALKRREQELKIQKQNLEEANTALRVLLKSREEDKRELEEHVISNVKQLVSTYITKLKQTPLDSRQLQYVDIVESNLNEITSPFSHHLSSKYFRLTPKEIQVADLVKNGKTTKEIAEIMNISTSVIGFHRKNIRKKFGLKSKKDNLQSFLMSFR
jgi:DNA-binding CsgD family transcriptional regulator